MPLCNQTWVVDVFVCLFVCLLNECAQVGETHYGDRLVFSYLPEIYYDLKASSVQFSLVYFNHKNNTKVTRVK